MDKLLDLIRIQGGRKVEKTPKFGIFEFIGTCDATNKLVDLENMLQIICVMKTN